MYDPTDLKKRIQDKEKLRSEMNKLERQKIGETTNLNRIKNLRATEETTLRHLKQVQEEIKIKLEEKEKEMNDVEKSNRNLTEMMKNNTLKKEALAREAHLFKRVIGEKQPGIDEVDSGIKKLKEREERLEANIKRLGDEALNLRRMVRRFR